MTVMDQKFEKRVLQKWLRITFYPWTFIIKKNIMIAVPYLELHEV